MMAISNLLFGLLCLIVTAYGFIPHPTIRLGAQAGGSITHTEMTQLAFIRALTRFLYETKVISSFDHNKEYTIDQLYELAYPTWTKEQIHLQTYPLKSILDTILAENALVDFDSWTKKLSAAHFDSEGFLNGSRRIMKLRRTIINDVLSKTIDLKQARQLLGQLLHTLQDFYSHSNWVELGNKNINENIGINEDIGPVASKTQSTCQNEGCTKITTKCSLLQKLTLRKCPLEYYECKNNIRPEIIRQGLLTSGYSVNQHNEDNQPIPKPTDVEKCSHGSIMDTSSHIPAIGGINKDTTNLIFSPHSDLHFEAATLAILATERFFNDLRIDLSNQNFDRLFAINPTQNDLNDASKAIATMRKFQFFTPSMSSALQIGSKLFNNIKQLAKDRWNKFKDKLFDDSADEDTDSFKRYFQL